VSDTTLSYFRVDKGSLYACAGNTDYWIINLVDRQVEVYRDPVADPTQLFGWRYDSRTDLTPPATVVPLAVSSTIAVAALLP
jgi:Uma2 family endonuclease